MANVTYFIPTGSEICAGARRIWKRILPRRCYVISPHAATEMALILASAAVMSPIVSKIFRGRIFWPQPYTVLVCYNGIPGWEMSLLAEDRAEGKKVPAEID